MPDFILYLIKANVAILLFYAAYYLLLRHLTFYNLNRYYLLFALVCSAGYPLIKADGLWVQHTPIPPEALLAISDWQQLPESSSSWPYVQALFLCIVGVLGIRFLFRLVRLRQIHVKSVPAVWKTYRYCQTKANISPFSFWKYIYLYPPRHQEHELKDIFEHEQVHINQLHSIDVLVAELFTLVFWFNPFVWLLRRSLCENLEFITDREVLHKGFDAKVYQYNLLKNLTHEQPQLGSSFTFKSLKNRIIMMNKKKSSPLHLGKYLLLVPAVILFVSILTLTRANKQEVSGNKQETNEKITTGTLPPGRTHQLKDIKVRINKTTGGNPLYVIDGIPQKDGKLSDVDPEEIESISVLKDAQATALYGDKGKNGVVIVTTKKGKGLNATKQERVLPDNSNLPDRDTSSFASASPLVLLDGKEIDMALLKQLDPNKIKSMDITKPKTGSRGRGTIRITTNVKSN